MIKRHCRNDYRLAVGTAVSSILAREKIDMIIVKRRAGQHHAVGMEGCGRDGSRAIMLQEARIWFDAV